MTEHHLDSEVIARAAAGQLAQAERAATLAHIEGCEACRTDLTYVVSFERRRRRRHVSTVALALLTAAAVVVLFPSEPSIDIEPGTVRSGGEGLVELTSYVPANGGDVEGDSVRFAWEGMGVNTHYRFQLSSATGEPLLDRALRDTTVYVATSALLAVGETYLWFVDALLEDGTAARTVPWSFTVRE